MYASSHYKFTWNALATHYQRNTVNKNNKCSKTLNDRITNFSLVDKIVYAYFIGRISRQTLVALISPSTPAPWQGKLGRVKVTSINQALLPKELSVALLHIACSQPGVVRI